MHFIKFTLALLAVTGLCGATNNALNGKVVIRDGSAIAGAKAKLLPGGLPALVQCHT